MDFVNSQHLTAQDGYVHPFRHAGEFTYSALLSEQGDQPASGTIVVAGSGAAVGEGDQHDVVLRWDAVARRFLPREADRKLTIRPNDFVMFQFETAVPGQPPGFILVKGEKALECDSRRLQTHDVFTHFFLNSGDYSYRLGRHTYQITVADHRPLADKELQAKVQEPLVIMVSGNVANIPHGNVVAGQTVMWVMERAENAYIQGITGGEAPRPAGRR